MHGFETVRNHRTPSTTHSRMPPAFLIASYKEKLCSPSFVWSSEALLLGPHWMKLAVAARKVVIPQGGTGLPTGFYFYMKTFIFLLSYVRCHYYSSLFTNTPYTVNATTAGFRHSLSVAFYFICVLIILVLQLSPIWRLSKCADKDNSHYYNQNLCAQDRIKIVLALSPRFCISKNRE